MIHKMRILPNSAKFSAGRPLLSAYNFSATLATTYSTYHLGAVASLKFVAIGNMTLHFSSHVYCGQTAGWTWYRRYTSCTKLYASPRRHCVIVLDGDPAPPSRKWTQQPPPPTFRPTALARIPAGPHFAHNRP